MKSAKLYCYILIAALILVLLRSTETQTAGPLFVKPGIEINESCSSWEDACTLETALSKAVSGDQIWVAQGTYTPTECTGSCTPTERGMSFKLINEVSIYGGFSGSETLLGERNWVDNVTLLSGDIGIEGEVSDNSIHVVDGSSVDATAVLDGFTIEAGFADDPNSDNGGGIYITSGSPTLANLIIKTNNSVGSGSGLFVDGGNPTLSNIYFLGNLATGNGGGMRVEYGAANLTNVAFLGNNANHGGGVSLLESDATLSNVLFSGNSANVNGGGIETTCSSSNSTRLTNLTITNNQAGKTNEGYGGGIYYDSCSITIHNSIFWSNADTNGENQIYGNDKPDFAYTLIQGSGGSDSWDSNLGIDMGGNIDDNPRFLDADGEDDTFGTADDNYKLGIGSPAIDMGDNSVVTVSTDLDGYPRIDNGTVDLGVYEALFNNNTWLRAYPLDLAGNLNDWEYTSVEQTIDEKGESRWYKFTVYPGSRISIKLSGLTVNYDLTLYGDIKAAYDALLAPENLDDLTKITAEYAPDAYAPDAYAPDAYAPDAYAPDAYAPDAYAPDAYAPDAYAPDAYAPDAYAPDAYAPDAYAPDAYAPDAYAPDAYAKDDYAPDAYAPDEAYTSAQMNTLIAVSAFDGKAGEYISVNTWDNSGDFYIRVKGRNAAFDPDNAFTLSVGQLSGACQNLDIGSEIPETAVSGNAKTLILTDFSRMGIAPNDGGEGEDLWNMLQTLAARPEVNGVLVDVGSDQEVSYANSEGDDLLNLQCPFAKNVVAREIKEIIQAYAGNNPLEYIVLVGNDNVIPFYRYPDRALLASEKDYEPPVQDDTTSYASLTLGFVLSQDYYGAEIELTNKNTRFPIAKLAVGRLVEEPGDIIAYLENYLVDTDGVIVPSTSLVTGYDFLEDAALAIADELALGIGNPPDNLIAPNVYSPRDPAVWSAEELSAVLLSNRHDIAFLSGHFSASSALAADYETRLLAEDVVLAGNGIFGNTLIFSAGCHAGYNIVTPHGILNLTEEPDWAQAFNQIGANLIAGTGYQYGDTDFIEYSERLYLYLSQQLRAGSGPISIGQALNAAKNLYLSNTPELRGIHEKALLEASLYGLPMFSIDMQGVRSTISGPTDLNVTPTPFLTKPGAILGLAYADVTVTPSLTEKQVPLSSIIKGVDTRMATYFEGSDGQVTRPGEPVLPLELYNVSVDQTVLRGIGFLGGSYTDHTSIFPLNGAPATEVRGVHPPFWTEVFFPIRTWNANYYDALVKGASGTTALALTPAQFLSDSPLVYTGLMRTYQDMDLRLYYNNHLTKYADGTIIPVLSAAPTIDKVLANSDGVVVDFSALVTGDPNVGIQEVWVTYTCEGSGGDPCYSNWESIDLTQDSAKSYLWNGSLILNGIPAEDIRYMVQATNGTGLVTLNTNIGAYFTPNYDPAKPPVEGAPTTLALALAWTADSYGSYVPMKANLSDSSGNGISGEIIQFAIGSQQRSIVTNEFGTAILKFPLLSPPGEYKVRAAFVGNSQYQESADFAVVTIEKQPTTLTISDEVVVAPDGLTGNYCLKTSISLQDSLTRPLQERTIFVLLRDSGGSIVQIAKTNSNYLGDGSIGLCGILGDQYTLEAYFLGTIPISGKPLILSDPIYIESFDSTSVSINSPPILKVDDLLVTVDEGQDAENSGTFSDPDGDTVVLIASVGEVTVNGDGTWSWSFGTADGSADNQTITIKADDRQGGIANANFDLVVNNVSPVIDPIVLNVDPISIDAQPVTVSATFSDPAGINDAYTCSIDFGDGTDPEVINVDYGDCQQEHTYAIPGVYRVSVTITDDDGGIGTATSTDFIVIYDSSEGFVTGGGWFNSPEGACQYEGCSYDTTGKANFGFVSKYKKGADIPSGETEFQFQAGDLNFHSTSYDWLVVAGSKAKFKGVGTINGEGEYKFMISAIDGKDAGEPDRFRIKIWYEVDGGEIIVYDNQIGSDETEDPTTQLGGGSITVHIGKKK